MKIIFCILLTFIIHDVTAQSKLSVLKITRSVKADIEKVAADYYVHFYNLKGEQIDETAHTIEYRSKLLPQGAMESTITQIKNQVNVYSWQAIMITTEDFDKAAEKYRELYRQLYGSSLNNGNHYKLTGEYDTPDEARAFASSILEPDVKEKAVRRLKIEVALNYQLPEWSVKILVYEKQADEEMRPTEKHGEQNQ